MEYEHLLPERTLFSRQNRGPLVSLMVNVKNLESFADTDAMHGCVGEQAKSEGSTDAG